MGMHCACAIIKMGASKYSNSLMGTRANLNLGKITASHFNPLMPKMQTRTCQTCSPLCISMSIHHTNIMSNLSVCPSHQLSNCHTITIAWPSICQSNYSSVCHTTPLTSLSLYQSHYSSVCHTTPLTSLSLYQSRILSVYHTIILTSLSLCQLQDSSVCQPTCDVIRPPIWPTVCLLSVTSVLPSANSMVKMPMSIPVQKFPHELNPGKLPSICISTDLPVLSVNSSPSAKNLSKFRCNYGEKNAVNYLHKNPAKSPSVSTLYIMPFDVPVHASSVQPVHTAYVMSVIAPVHASSIQPVHTSCITSVIAPICASPVLSVHPSDDKRQEFLDGFPSTKYGKKNLSEITVKFPYDITLTLHQSKFLEETTDTSNRVLCPGNFTSTQIRVKFTVINLRNYVLGVFQVMSCTMRCAHGSIDEILMEWDPGPTNVVQRLWDPGGPSHSSRSIVPTDVDELGKLKSYLYYIYLPGLSFLPFLVTVMLDLAPNNHLGKIDCMGSFRYLPRLDQQVYMDT